jgi:two-component system alkaline phosphatase synthesis response regulator PhoP
MKVVENIINRINETEKDNFTKEEIIKLLKGVGGINTLPTITLNDITLIPEKFKAMIGDKEVTLTFKEFYLLYMLMENPERTFTRDEMLSNIWGDDVFVGHRTVDVHICKVNKKFGKPITTTTKGKGYRCCL